MSSTIQLMKRYRVTAGKLQDFVGVCYAADMNPDSLHGVHALLEIDAVVSLFVHPKYLELVIEPDPMDLRQILIQENANDNSISD